MPLERLQKIIAKAGVSSRREAEEYIRTGRVTVNGKVITELGTRADPLRDHIKVDGKLLRNAEEHRYILMNKPREVMTTTVDPEGRTTVLDLLKGIRERLFPVGRLDYHSEGLLLLTNDGDLAYQVSHPSNGSIKTYHVKVRGVPPAAIIDKLSRGVVLDGKRTLPCEIHPLRTTGRSNEEGNSWWEVRLREGRTNQIRRMFQYQGFPVSKLRRVAIGDLTDPKLGPGEWRELTDTEIRRLLAEPAEPRAPRQRRGAATTRKAAAPRGRPSASRKGVRGASSTRASSTRRSSSDSKAASKKATRPLASSGSATARTRASTKRGASLPMSERGATTGRREGGTRTRGAGGGTGSSRPSGPGPGAAKKRPSRNPGGGAGRGSRPGGKGRRS